MRKKSLSLASIILFMVVQGVYAVPPGFNIQGRLTDANGINRNGVYSIKFTIFDAATLGAELWSKTYPSPGNPPSIPPTAAVTVRNGNFQIILQDPDDTERKLADAINTAAPFLEIKVLSGPGVTTEEPPLVPRQALVSVPFALKAQMAEESVPRGVIVMWSGSVDTIPAGWALCDGTNNTPDLRERFIVGSGGDNPDVSGPGYTKDSVGGENEHVLTLAEMPQHRHNMQFRATYSAKYQGGLPYLWIVDTAFSNAYTDYQGNSVPHQNRPPYYALAFIMKK